MKHLLFCFLLFSNLAFAQEFGFDIHHTTLQQFIKMEKAVGGKSLPATSEYVSFDGDAQPMLYQRKQKNIPDLISYYYFKKRDSTMSYVLYEWDVYNFEKNDNNKKSFEFQKAFIAKYDSLEQVITTLYGRSEAIGNLTEISKAETRDGLKKNNIWRPNDSTEIEMYTTISNFYNKSGMITINPTHRIRLYIRNTKKNQPEPTNLNAIKLDSLDAVVKGFLNSLKLKDLLKAKKYISDIVISKVTDTQLNSFIKSINLDKEITLFYSGVQLGLDGRAFTLLQYKYSGDTSNAPNELIKVVFDDKNKILGIQPIKLQERVNQ